MEKGCAAVYRQSDPVMQLLAGGNFIWPEGTVGKANNPGVYTLLLTPSSTEMSMKYRYEVMGRVGMHEASKWSLEKLLERFCRR